MRVTLSLSLVPLRRVPNLNPSLPALQIFSLWQMARAMAAWAPHWPDIMIIAAQVLGLQQEQEQAQDGAQQAQE